MDNLESQTYEVFEKDPIKYSQYQQVGSMATPQRRTPNSQQPRLFPNHCYSHQAVYKCLLDRVPEEQKDTNVQ